MQKVNTFLKKIFFYYNAAGRVDLFLQHFEKKNFKVLGDETEKEKLP